MCLVVLYKCYMPLPNKRPCKISEQTCILSMHVPRFYVSARTHTQALIIAQPMPPNNLLHIIGHPVVEHSYVVEVCANSRQKMWRQERVNAAVDVSDSVHQRWVEQQRNLAVALRTTVWEANIQNCATAFYFRVFCNRNSQVFEAVSLQVKLVVYHAVVDWHSLVSNTTFWSDAALNV